MCGSAQSPPSANTAIDNYRQAVGRHEADVIEVVDFDSLCWNPMNVAASDCAAWTADHQSIRPFREDRS
jgi:hypothetical protein